MLRLLAHTISFLFHPLLIPSYVLLVLLCINPYMFGVNSVGGNSIILLQVFLSTFLLPAFSLLMLKQLDFVKSVELEDKQDRIIPYIITGMFYIGLSVFFIKTPNHSPLPLSVFILGATIALWAAFIVNLFTKISAHAVGIAGFLGIIVISMKTIGYDQFILDLNFLGAVQMSMKSLLMWAILFAGLVGSARLFLKAHLPFQVYLGYFIGFLTQFIAFNFLSNY